MRNKKCILYKIFFLYPDMLCWSPKIVVHCLALKDRCPPRKAGTSLGMENVAPFPHNYYNYEIKGFSSKDMGKGITALY